ncbi:ATP-binding cassette domain-containing protein [Cognatiyoonia sp. IB215182]|uniref:ATP-binding cassette domain-containing protein n=1 Tax=Cognatiyoonia sp. IB215182 TaxID=3097353 RepID=UPI002A180DD5|nr:ATP-binding cassette domain-containing protein [Cognatiyoonia sp. IB215182]MDX8354312.1 ATP-binding cassette domain-containing protein [Cognatiyoonia sp. IB215182]
MIVFSNVSRFHRNERKVAVVLRDISLVVPPGGRVGIFGSYGAGKSTLARLASKVEYPDEGTITQVGHVSWPIGFSGFLQKEMTGADNIRTVAGLMGCNSRKLFAYVTAFTGLGTILDFRVGTYAAFERDRLAVALALAFPADTYVMDGLPGLGGTEFQSRCLGELDKRLRHASLLLLSRNRRHLESLCDTFFALNDGVLLAAASADHAEALSMPVIGERTA